MHNQEQKILYMFPPLEYAALEVPSLSTAQLKLFINVFPPLLWGGLESNSTIQESAATEKTPKT